MRPAKTKAKAASSFMFWALLALLGSSASVRAATPEASGSTSLPSDPATGPTSRPPAPEAPETAQTQGEAEPRPGKTSAKLIPLPIYATLPNEGSTWGFMPVFLVVEDANQRTESIYAPSVSWNRIIGTTATWRLFHYPTDTRSITFTASVSSKVNYGTLLIWSEKPKEAHRWTTDVFFRGQRSVFFRFFGLGPDTAESNESSLTRLRGDFYVRPGYNLTRELNVGAQLEIARDLVQPQTAPGYPSALAVYPNVPGMGGATILYEGVGLRYDTRENAEYSTEGMLATASAGTVQGLAGTDDYQKVELETVGLAEELGWIRGAGRAYWSYVTDHRAPFYYQSSLGGSYRLRGFTEDRFIDQGAWEIEIEQRIRLFQTHIYGVTADWRVDPFFSLGQVYSDSSEMFARPRWATGLGFRAWVQPNVLGRVDLGVAGEGLKIYVELGYPF